MGRFTTLDEMVGQVDRHRFDQPGACLLGIRNFDLDEVVARLRSYAAAKPISLIAWMEDDKIRFPHLLLCALAEEKTGNDRVDRGRLRYAKRFQQAPPDKRWVLP